MCCVGQGPEFVEDYLLARLGPDKQHAEVPASTTPAWHATCGVLNLLKPAHMVRQVRILDDGHRAKASAISPPSGPAFERIARSARATMGLDRLVVAPYLVVGGTDRYGAVCSACLSSH